MRSYLYVPGDAPEKLANALDRGADAVIVDLEDAVARENKETARKAVATWLRTVPAGAEVWVRINPGPRGHEDAREVVGPGLRGLCVAKAESPVQLDALDAVLSIVEADARVAPRSVLVGPLLESAGAILAAPAIARAPRVAWLQIAEVVLCAELGVTPSADEHELLFARSQVVLASAAAGIGAPIGSVSTNFRDLDLLRAGTLALKRMGFRGRACVHPAQVPVANEAFTPSGAEVAAAHDVVERYAAALRDGLGVCLDAGGRLIDQAVVRSARRTVSLVGDRSRF